MFTKLLFRNKFCKLAYFLRASRPPPVGWWSGEKWPASLVNQESGGPPHCLLLSRTALQSSAHDRSRLWEGLTPRCLLWQAVNRMCSHDGSGSTPDRGHTWSTNNHIPSKPRVLLCVRRPHATALDGRGRSWLTALRQLSSKGVKEAPKKTHANNNNTHVTLRGRGDASRAHSGFFSFFLSLFLFKCSTQFHTLNLLLLQIVFLYVHTCTIYTLKWLYSWPWDQVSTRALKGSSKRESDSSERTDLTVKASQLEDISPTQKTCVTKRGLRTIVRTYVL